MTMPNPTPHTPFTQIQTMLRLLELSLAVTVQRTMALMETKLLMMRQQLHQPKGTRPGHIDITQTIVAITNTTIMLLLVSQELQVVPSSSNPRVSTHTPNLTQPVPMPLHQQTELLLLPRPQQSQCPLQILTPAHLGSPEQWIATPSLTLTTPIRHTPTPPSQGTGTTHRMSPRSLIEAQLWNL